MTPDFLPVTDSRPRILIPVLGAPYDAGPIPGEASISSARTARAHGQILSLGVLVMVTWVFLQILVEGGSIAFGIGVAFRYLLWPGIALAVVLHLQRRGPAGLLGSIGIVIPFFVIGIASAVFSFDPITAARMLVFWILGVLGAAVIGNDVAPNRLMRWLFWMLFLLFFVSAAAAIAVPRVGRLDDLRTAGGAWRGVLPGKNQFGAIAVYGLIIGVLVRDVRLVPRLAMLAIVAVCLVMSESSGAYVQALASMAFIVLVLVLRRLPLSVPLRATLLIGTLVSAVAFSFILRSALLGLIGRDATFTGRSTVWPAYLHRALDYWLIGAGPGSFTQLSFATVDIGSTMEDLGIIHTPHNMFIAAFGEVGLVGFIAFVAIFLHFMFVYPFRTRSRYAVATGAIAAASVVGGMGETREVYGAGMGMFLLILTSTLARRDDQRGGAETPPAGQVPDDQAWGTGPTALGR